MLFYAYHQEVVNGQELFLFVKQTVSICYPYVEETLEHLHSVKHKHCQNTGAHFKCPLVVREFYVV